MNRTDRWYLEAIQRLGDWMGRYTHLVIIGASMGLVAAILAAIARECACAQELMWAITATVLLAYRPRRTI